MFVTGTMLFVYLCVFIRQFIVIYCLHYLVYLRQGSHNSTIDHIGNILGFGIVVLSMKFCIISYGFLLSLGYDLSGRVGFTNKLFVQISTVAGK